jgi:hypothetical protein
MGNSTTIKPITTHEMNSNLRVDTDRSIKKGPLDGLFVFLDNINVRVNVYVIFPNIKPIAMPSKVIQKALSFIIYFPFLKPFPIITNE